MTFEPIRIIAWGNVGRRDDGVALVLAERLERHFADDPRIIVQQYHQLGPELVDDLDRCSAAIFIDAHVRTDEAVTVERVMPSVSGGLDTHHCSPESLLGLVRSLGLRLPPAWLIGIRGHDWEFGDTLSEPTRRGMLAAEKHLHDLIAGLLNGSPATTS